MANDNGWWAMAPSACTEIPLPQQALLLRLARHAIAAQLGDDVAVPAETDSELLQARRGVFVTLTMAGKLRGCIGTLANDVPLIESIPDCARGAAFRDPRFAPVTPAELSDLCVEISILTEPQPLVVLGRDQLLAELRPGIDGLILKEDTRRSTFLPQVWEQLPQPEAFVSHLLRKAGLPADYWSERLRCSRYQCIKFSEADLSQPPA